VCRAAEPSGDVFYLTHSSVCLRTDLTPANVFISGSEGSFLPKDNTASIIVWTKTLTNAQREAFVRALNEVFCTECGTLYTPQRPICYCTRDE
jgi:hypothetical protein